MKRWTACLVALALLLAACAALAEGVSYIGDMTVVNCEEWVSLRAAPSTSAKRLMKVPLGATVTDASWEDGQGDFMYCCYEGVYGYILSDYLEKAGNGWNAALDESVNGLRVRGERSSLGDGEYLLVTCSDANGRELWGYETSTDYMTELTMTDAFIGGWAQDPMVMVYNAQKGLVALDLWSGEVRWTLTQDEANLGASISHAVSPSTGICYIGGYYGPDPVAIDGSGRVLWRSDSGGCTWLYELYLEEDRISAHYDMMAKADTSGWVYYDYDGRMLGMKGE